MCRGVRYRATCPSRMANLHVEKRSSMIVCHWHWHQCHWGKLGSTVATSFVIDVADTHCFTMISRLRDICWQKQLEFETPIFSAHLKFHVTVSIFINKHVFELNVIDSGVVTLSYKFCKLNWNFEIAELCQQFPWLPPSWISNQIDFGSGLEN